MRNRVIQFSSEETKEGRRTQNRRELPEQFTKALESLFYNESLHEAAVQKLGLGWHDAHNRIMELGIYFYLCFKHRGQALPTPTRIDAVWHIFLDRDEEYRQYCQNCFGGIIEHRPYADDEPPRMSYETMRCLVATCNADFAGKWAGQTTCDGLFKAKAA